jgi:hypothetical protein
MNYWLQSYIAGLGYQNTTPALRATVIMNTAKIYSRHFLISVSPLKARMPHEQRGYSPARMGPILIDREANISTATANLDLKYDRSLGEATDIALRLYWDDYKYTGGYSGNVIWGTLNKSRAHGEWWGSKARLSSQLFKALHVTAGAEYIDNVHKDHKNYDVDPYYVYDDNKKQSTVWVLYLQNELTLSREPHPERRRAIRSLQHLRRRDQSPTRFDL